MATVLNLLHRLQKENLHGPASPFPRGQQHQKDLSGNDPVHDAWILIGDDHDLDSRDPRWFELFLEYFIEASPDTNDDLLFFVRGPPQEGMIPEPEPDPIFVKRKVNNAVPHLDDVVDWKQTFFLNLIIQSSCTLTVTICKKADVGDSGKKKSLLSMPNEDKVLNVGGTPSQPQSTTTSDPPMSSSPPTNSSPPTSSIIPPLPTNLTSSPTASTPTTASTTASSSPPPKKSRMVALRRVTKKVYAAPYKSRMDVKDAFMNECSYPLVYYTVNDYESNDLHLPIYEKEYLCVELSCILPADAATALAAKNTPVDVNIPVENDDSPFPVPEGHVKIILFQGAVPYASLLDVYQQKGLAAQTHLRLSWSKLAGVDGSNNNLGSGGTGSTSHDDTLPIRTEYIMMRGPHGKGQCQVAITENLPEEEGGGGGSKVGEFGRAGRSGVPTLGDRLRWLGTAVTKQIGVVTGAGAGQGGVVLRKPESLKCSMTYVNVPWQSIISDLTTYAEQHKQQQS
ncbi:hypothetical protein HDV00_001765 [Rhizophlyctis rosea]|nr:hypothetical protein HDV00_001765 [Rhizophlyctis rosea]